MDKIYIPHAFSRLLDTQGLPPSNTGKPGGRHIGYQMMNFIEQGGPLDLACQGLLAQEFGMIWGFAQQRLIHCKKGSAKKRVASKTKYSCSTCGLNAWAKPSVKIACVTCATLMREEVR